MAMAQRFNKNKEGTEELRVVEKGKLRWQGSRSFLRMAVIGVKDGQYGAEVFEPFVDMSESTEGIIEELVKLETEAWFMCMDVQKTSFGLCLTGYSKVIWSYFMKFH